MIDKVKEAFKGEEPKKDTSVTEKSQLEQLLEIDREVEKKKRESKLEKQVVGFGEYPDHLIQQAQTSDRLRKAMINGQKITCIKSRDPNAKNPWSYLVQN